MKQLFFVIVFFLVGVGLFEIANKIKPSSLPDKRNELPYFNPIMDTDLMKIGLAGYEMGIKRNGNNKWEEDSVLLRAVILKPIKPNQNDYSKIN